MTNYRLKWSARHEGSRLGENRLSWGSATIAADSVNAATDYAHKYIHECIAYYNVPVSISFTIRKPTRWEMLLDKLRGGSHEHTNG